MRIRVTVTSLTAIGLLLAGATTAQATDGHLLHGVGAINSAMGGIGVATPSSLLGAFYVNPAGLLAFDGTATELGFEMMKAERGIASTVGSFAGSTESRSDFTPIPALGWSQELFADRLAIGVAGLGIGGFGVDYPADPNNPMLAPRPQGFGNVFSSFSLMRIIPAAAYQVTPQLRLGAALNLNWASLAVDPMPVAAPAVDPGPDGVPNTADDRAFYSSATADGAFGIGAQLGLQYAVTPAVAVGLAYTTPQLFQDFEYNAVYENPNLPNYNTPRVFTFAMDVPAVYAGGVSWQPGSAWMVGVDAKYIDYENTEGFEETGFNPDGSLRGFGWKSIWSVAAGAQFRPTAAIALRAGYNYSDNPIADEYTMFNLPAPAVVQHHATFGLGYLFDNGFGLDVGYYRAFENTIAGPIQGMGGAAPGTEVKTWMSEHSILVGFTFSPAGAGRGSAP